MIELVSCQYGVVRGIPENNTTAFYDIPYGKDSGRFAYLAESDKWKGVRDGTQPGTVFPQYKSQPGSILGRNPFEQYQSEDSFTLNIWTTDTELLKPVLFWIHGGGWLSGGGSLSWYNGSIMASSGEVVVVTINYRLGILGSFLDEDLAPGNQALHDIIAALSWAKENIASFGGDPECITVAGQSAGAWYSVALMGIEKVSGWFKRVALFSFPGDTESQSKEDALSLSQSYLSELGLDANTKEQALSTPPRQVLRAQITAARHLQEAQQLPKPPHYLPFEDGELIKGPLIAEAVRVSGGRVDILAGTTTDEVAAFVYTTPLREDASYRTLVKQLSHEAFTQPTRDLLSALSKLNRNTYAYELAYEAADEKLLACHCLELPFLFNNFEHWEGAPLLAGLDPTINAQFAAKFQRSIINFTLSGNPNGSGAFGWPKFSGNPGEVLVIDTQSITNNTDSYEPACVESINLS